MDERDADLIARFGREPAVFGELYRRYVDRIYSYIYYRVGDAIEAEDLTARTFYQALVGLPGYVDHGAPFSAWLYRIAHNLVANWHRDRLRRETVSLDGLAQTPGDETVGAELQDGSVAAAIRSLEPDRQSVLLMKYHGLSNAEIAIALGRTESAVKSLYHRTLVELRARLLGGGALASTGANGRVDDVDTAKRDTVA